MFLRLMLKEDLLKDTLIILESIAGMPSFIRNLCPLTALFKVFKIPEIKTNSGEKGKVLLNEKRIPKEIDILELQEESKEKTSYNEGVEETSEDNDDARLFE
uniref:Uncharacterized protein n=1 Tax=Rhizophagus irregularis (strain DAOM 181602 / DAOM 197198 / MUCL 43194) TaxID=747089 RepID=U9T7D5_RHIID